MRRPEAWARSSHIANEKRRQYSLPLPRSLPRVVCGVHEGDSPGPDPMRLHDGLVLRHEIVRRARRDDDEAPCRHRLHLTLIELLTHAEVKRPGYHRDVLNVRMLVGWHLEAPRHFHPKRKGTRLCWVTLEHRPFRSGRKRRRRVDPFHRIRRDHAMVSFVARWLRGSTDHESTDEAHCQSHIRYRLGHLHHLSPPMREDRVPRSGIVSQGCA